MGKFKHFLQTVNEAVVDAPNGMFAKVLPTTQSTVDLSKYFQDFFPLAEDLHATLVYTKAPCMKISLPAVDRRERFGVVTTGVEYWEGHDKEGYIVVKLQSVDLLNLHEQFAKSLGDAALDGYKDKLFTFPDYQPHITLKNPVPNPDDWYSKVTDANVKCKINPLKFDMYYGGYVLLDPKE